VPLKHSSLPRLDITFIILWLSNYIYTFNSFINLLSSVVFKTNYYYSFFRYYRIVIIIIIIVTILAARCFQMFNPRSALCIQLITLRCLMCVFLLHTCNIPRPLQHCRCLAVIARYRYLIFSRFCKKISLTKLEKYCLCV